MTRYMLVFLSALLLAIGGTPLARRLALRLGVIDRPSKRKFHKSPTPLLGGIAIYTAAIIVLLVYDYFYIRELVGILVGASLVSFMGIWDDRRPMRPLIKLVGQIAAAGILVLSGVQVQFLRNDVLNIAVTVVWIVGITNAMNLMDNMDGLSSGIGAVGSAFFFLLSAMSGQYLVGSLSAATLGACIGFLLYNVNPARIFMGDSGSLFLGFMLAAVGIKLRFPSNVDFVTWMIPVIVLGLPIFDTTLVIISRLRRGKNPLTTPGKDHVSHRLVAMGLTQREAVLVLYLACGAAGVIAMFMTQASVLEGYAIGVAVAILGVWALWRLEQVPGL
jgi:UDP-GlcNAc:undecaprenyl-phosphate GlcNAc-1-phosphate transferase